MKKTVAILLALILVFGQFTVVTQADADDYDVVDNDIESVVDDDPIDEFIDNDADELLEALCEDCGLAVEECTCIRYGYEEHSSYEAVFDTIVFLGEGVPQKVIPEMFSIAVGPEVAAQQIQFSDLKSGEVWIDKTVIYHRDEYDNFTGSAAVTIYLWAKGFYAYGHNNNLMGGDESVTITAYLNDFDVYEWFYGWGVGGEIENGYTITPPVAIYEYETDDGDVLGPYIQFTVHQNYFLNASYPLALTYVLWLSEREPGVNWRLSPYETSGSKVRMTFDPSLDNDFYFTDVEVFENRFFFTAGSWNNGGGKGGLVSATIYDKDIRTSIIFPGNSRSLSYREDISKSPNGKLITAENYPFDRNATQAYNESRGWNKTATIIGLDGQTFWWFLEWQKHVTCGITENLCDPQKPVSEGCGIYHYKFTIIDVPIGDGQYRDFVYEFRLNNPGGMNQIGNEIPGDKISMGIHRFPRSPDPNDAHTVFQWEWSDGVPTLVHGADITVWVQLGLEYAEVGNATLYLAKEFSIEGKEYDWGYGRDTAFLMMLYGYLTVDGELVPHYASFAELPPDAYGNKNFEFLYFSILQAPGTITDSLGRRIVSELDLCVSRKTVLSNLPVYEIHLTDYGDGYITVPILYFAEEQIDSFFGARNSELARLLVTIDHRLDGVYIGYNYKFTFADANPRELVLINNFEHGIGFLELYKKVMGFAFNWGINTNTVFYVRIWDNENKNWLMFDPKRIVENDSNHDFWELPLFQNSHWCVGNHDQGLSGDYDWMWKSGRYPILEIPITAANTVRLSNLWSGLSYRVFEVRRTGTFMAPESTCPNGGYGVCAAADCLPCKDTALWQSIWSSGFDRQSIAEWVGITYVDDTTGALTIEGGRWEIVDEIFFADPEDHREWFNDPEWYWGVQYPANNYPMLDGQHNERNLLAFNQNLLVEIQNRFWPKYGTVDVRKELAGHPAHWNVDGNTEFNFRIRTDTLDLNGLHKYLVFAVPDTGFSDDYIIDEDWANYRVIGFINLDKGGVPIIDTFESFCAYLGNNWHHPDVADTITAQIPFSVNESVRLLHFPIWAFSNTTTTYGGQFRENYHIIEVFPDGMPEGMQKGQIINTQFMMERFDVVDTAIVNVFDMKYGNLAIGKELAGDYLKWDGVNNKTVFTARLLAKNKDDNLFVVEFEYIDGIKYNAVGFRATDYNGDPDPEGVFIPINGAEATGLWDVLFSNVAPAALTVPTGYHKFDAGFMAYILTELPGTEPWAGNFITKFLDEDENELPVGFVFPAYSGPSARSVTVRNIFTPPEVRLDRFRVSYHSDLHDYGNVPETEYFYAGEWVDIRHHGDLARDRHDFDYWLWQGPESIRWLYPDGFYMPNHDVDLYAQWVPWQEGPPTEDPSTEELPVDLPPPLPPPVPGRLLPVSNIYIPWTPRYPVRIPGAGGQIGTEQGNELPELVPVNPIPVAPVHFAYMIGYAEDGTIRPNANITRAEVATIFFRLISDDYRAIIWSQANSFGDVNLDKWFNNAVSTMENGRLFINVPVGVNFYPNQAATRAEFAVMVVNYLGLGHYRVTGGNAFTDIEGHWARDAINVAYLQGWVNGFGDGTFRPDQLITRAEVAALVNRALGRLPESPSDLLENMIRWPDNMDDTAWFFTYVQEASNSHYHEMKSDGIHERWIRLVPPRDWRLLERPYSRPHHIKAV
ncbi:MAG: S-layer homology domain-containing protein [Firmicutes bacterium]|nr:S-layer homology domain-containing protein [Bacillota bacterium]